MEFISKLFNQVTHEELYAVLRLRSEVFVVEQNCVYNDLDGLDPKAIHLLGYHNHTIVAYSRILPQNTRFKEVSIGRVVLDKNYRGNGYGKLLMEKSLKLVKSRFDETTIRISAQGYLLDFYQGLGFYVVSDEYLEDGIPHVEMLYRMKK